VSSSLLSRSSSQAIQALTYLAMQPAGKLCGTQEISDSEHIPRPTIPKILLSLRRARMVRSSRGIRGGYNLAVRPEEVSLLAIVRCVDGAPLNDCLLEDRPCSSQHKCALHPCWSAVREQVLDYLEQTTLADLVRFRRSGSGKRSYVSNPPFGGVQRNGKCSK
jgi:Rrf2 family transcriptional regulator, iron-sulfur cluster assembly transcription factor